MEKLKQLKWWHFLLIIFAIIIVINLINFFIAPPKNEKTKISKANDSANTNSSESKFSDSTTTEWSFSDDINKMDDSHTFYAELKSSNKLDLKFPYQGENHGNLNIRNEGGENIVSLSIDKGQIYIGGQNTEIQVRFDKDTPEVYNCVGAKDYDPKYLFVEDAITFVKRLKTSKSLIIEATIFENGTQQLEFNTKGFKWEH